MNRVLKFFVFLIGVLMIGWGGMLLALGFVGDAASARNVNTRRVGGERNESAPNQYTYSIDYEFVTKAGEVESGHAQGIGNSYSVKTPSKIRYLAAFPKINAPEDDCGIAVYPLVLLGAGSLILWSFGRRKKRVAGKAVSKSARARTGARAKVARPAANALAAKDWLRKYRRDARRYAWIFFVGVVVVIGILVRVGLEEWSSEWFYATGFAALVTWILAMYSRRQAESSWAGVVSSKEVKETRDSRSSDMNTTRISYLVHVETDRGKRKKIRVSPTVFDSYREGGRVQKIAGLNFPLPEEVDEETAICPVCGNLLSGASEQCPSCRAPVFSLAEFE